jgi:hypothetical protein
MPVTTEAKFKNLTFLQNPLNKYDSVNYRLRVTIVKPQDAVFHDPSRGITLAESATTSRFILTDLEYKQTYSLSTSSRTSFFVQGTMTIFDPSGLRFMDAIVQSASTLGVKNGIINCRYIIEAEFVGTTPDSGKPTIESQRGMYVVQVYKISVRLTEKGGEFKLHFSGLDADAARHVNVTFAAVKSIRHAGNMKSYIKELETVLQKEEAAKKGRGEQEYENEWHFVLEPFIASSPHFAFTGDKEEEQNWRERNQKPLDGSDGQLNASREGSNILQCIDNAFLDTKAIKFGLNQDNSLSDPLEITTQAKAADDGKKIKQWWRVDIMVEPDTKWDSITNDYVKKFYYYIFLQDTPDTFFGPYNQLDQGQLDSITSTRLSNAAYTNNLHKRYDYYYTGRNTEILKFDLQAEYGIFIAEHLLRQYSGGSGAAPGPALTQLVGNAVQGLGRLTGVLPAQPENSIGQKLTYAEEGITSTPTTDKNAASGVGGGTAGNQIVFPHIYSYDNRAMADKKSSAQIPDKDTLRRMKAQHVYDRLEYTGPDFFKVTMTIRGDPYWFGTTKPVYEKGGSRAVPTLKDYNDARADFFYGQQKFYIEVDTADYAEETKTGLVNTTRAITGVYTVTQCVNRFVGGRFEQELTGVRDITVDGPKLWEAIQKADLKET